MGTLEELSQMPGHLARRFHQQSVALFQTAMTDAGIDLTSVQYAALVALLNRPGVDQITLAGLIALDRTTIGGVVDRLEQKGLVSRSVSEADRRAKVLVVTNAGAMLVGTASPAVAQAQARLVAGVTPEEGTELVRLLDKAILALAPDE